MIIANYFLPLAFSAIAVGALTPDTSLPTVDLGYGVYRATYYNAPTPGPPSLVQLCILIEYPHAGELRRLRIL